MDLLLGDILQDQGMTGSDLEIEEIPRSVKGLGLQGEIHLIFHGVSGVGVEIATKIRKRAKRSRS